jgi:hypothetical protein
LVIWALRESISSWRAGPVGREDAMVQVLVQCCWKMRDERECVVVLNCET